MLRGTHCHAHLCSYATIDPSHEVRVHAQRALGLPGDAEQGAHRTVVRDESRNSGACSCCRREATLRRGGLEEKATFSNVQGSATHLPPDDGQP